MKYSINYYSIKYKKYYNFIFKTFVFIKFNFY